MFGGRVPVSGSGRCSSPACGIRPSLVIIDMKDDRLNSMLEKIYKTEM